MPVIITQGYGDDSFALVTQDIVGSVIVEEAIFGTLLSEQKVTGTVTLEEGIIGAVTTDAKDTISGTVIPMQEIIGIVFEEGPCMITESNKITIFSGDDRTLSLSVNKSDGMPIDITGAKIWLTVKIKLTDEDADALIQKRNTAAGGSDSEILITDGASGQGQIFLIPSDTEDTAAGIYQYDIQVILASGKKHTITRSQFCVKEDVTKTVS